MTMTTRKNPTTKALQSTLAKMKKNNDAIRYEWEMACNTNVNRGNVYSQEYIHETYERGNYNGYNRHNHGATKLVHLENAETGKAFEYIVIKRHMKHGYLPERRNNKATGNQLIDEINCWNEYAETEKADLLCPILKYFTSKSDKVTSTSEKMQYNVVIIAQKAVYVGDAKSACKKAWQLNLDNDLFNLNNSEYESIDERYKKLQALSNENNWRDAMYNPGNSGVIFDYSKGCYKAVFIDYAL